MVRKAAAVAVLVAAASSAACLRKETTHVLHLSPDGGIGWTASEVNVYSDEQDPGARFAEEQAFIGGAMLGEHRLAQALRALGPDSLVDTHVLRSERPFHVVTQARFSSVDQLFRRLVSELGVKGAVKLSRDGDATRLELTLDFSRGVEEKASRAQALIEDGGLVRIVLTQGRFRPSQGFDVVDGVSATVSREWLAAAEEAAQEGRPITLVLAWTSEG